MCPKQRTDSLVKQLIGGRRPRGTIDPDQVLAEARSCILALKDFDCADAQDVRALKVAYGRICRGYYTAAAVSRRRELASDTRANLLNLLFAFRSKIETKLLSEFSGLPDQEELFRFAAVGFFGASAKQGVSIRYPLSTCSPTKTCGARCYAHDGRDRELHLIFRAALNGYLGACYESGAPALKAKILDLLSPAIDKAIRAALTDQESAQSAGFSRRARIRFSHIGEMSRHPSFVNALAAEIKAREPNVQCVIYTRHQDSKHLDEQLFAINFTIDHDLDPRRQHAPRSARLVSSAWDGKVSSHASINFLEHHVEKGSKASGEGVVCPVTASHKEKPSCDIARCEACFVPHAREH